MLAMGQNRSRRSLAGAATLPPIATKVGASNERRDEPIANRRRICHYSLTSSYS